MMSSWMMQNESTQGTEGSPGGTEAENSPSGTLEIAGTLVTPELAGSLLVSLASR